MTNRKVNSGLIRTQAYGVVHIIDAWDEGKCSENRAFEQINDVIRRIAILLDRSMHGLPGYGVPGDSSSLTARENTEIIRLRSELAKLKADRDALLQVLKSYRRRDDCPCPTCQQADRAIKQAESPEAQHD
jgi:hypothetical protein